MYSGSRKICERDESGGGDLNVQMNEFPEGHVKVPSLEFVHFAHCQKILACRGSLKRNNPSCYKYLPKDFRTRKAEQSKLCAQIRASSLAGGMPVW